MISFFRNENVGCCKDDKMQGSAGDTQVEPIEIQEEIKGLIKKLSKMGYNFTYDNNVLTIRKKEDKNEDI